MIIPTLRISDHESYKSMVKTYCRNDVKILRVNMSRHSMERYCADIKYINGISDYPFDIMADIPLPGRKYRLSLPNEKELNIKRGQIVKFTTRNNQILGTIPVSIDSFNSIIAQGEKIIIGDGELTLTVDIAACDKIVAIADNPAMIRGQRSFAVPGALSYEMYSKDFLDMYIDAFKSISPTKVVLSFSEDLAVIEQIEAELRSCFCNISVVPKIETQLGIDNCDKICIKFKEIMLGRGDLALFSNPTDFGDNQNCILLTASNNKTNVLVATDILTSLYEHHVPTRGDLTDLYYLKSMKIKDVVASAGISMSQDLFELFCYYAKSFK